MGVNGGAGNAISLSEIQSYYGGSNPISLSEYNRGGSLVPATKTDTTSNTGVSSTSNALNGSFSANQSKFDFDTFNNGNVSAGAITGNITFGSSATVDFVGSDFFLGATSGVQINTNVQLGNVKFTSYDNRHVVTSAGGTYTVTADDVSFGTTIRASGFITEPDGDRDNGNAIVFDINGTDYYGGWQNGGAGAEHVFTASQGDVITLGGAGGVQQLTVYPQDAQAQGRSDTPTFSAGTYALTSRIIGGNNNSPYFRYELQYSGGGTVTYSGFNASPAYTDTNVTTNTNTNVPSTISAGNPVNMNIFNAPGSPSP